MYNRPIAPHISIYLPQISSIFSILNRISSVYIIIVCTIFIMVFKFVLNLYSLYYFINYLINSLVYIYFYIILISSFMYHFLQGFMQILWNFNLFLNLNNISKSSIIVLLFVIFYLIKIIILFL
uniref:Succinate:cytochrome c oxidoreductase subunit 3 n=1 Tax=Plocamium cartilagineum TaxID=31452 RepID=A0A0E3DBJ7_PLOCA|nr:succinate:cytochrome c oxidoreductase subunit 3 [Plocamium cartilagineum]